MFWQLVSWKKLSSTKSTFRLGKPLYSLITLTNNCISKLIKLLEFQADFKKEEASVNCCRLSRDNSLIATGSDDCVVRVFKLGSDFKS